MKKSRLILAYFLMLLIRLYVASFFMSIGNCIIYFVFGAKDAVPLDGFFTTLFISSVAVIIFDKWDIWGLLLFLSDSSLGFVFVGIINILVALSGKILHFGVA